ncbi:hypothetical protein LCGC14_1334510, partial [marine sediment metagenome]
KLNDVNEFPFLLPKEKNPNPEYRKKLLFNKISSLNG